MPELFQVQNTVALVLGVALLAMEVFALIEAVRYRADAYVAAGKLTKPAWCAITALCAVLGFLTVANPLNLFGLLGVVGSAVFLADVRPALQRVLGRRSNDGPYGPW